MKKTWNFLEFRSEALTTFFRTTLHPLRCGALVLTDGSPLHVFASSPGDIATLPQAASLCYQYLQLKDGEIAVVNDPYSGGSHLSDVTFVMAVAIAPSADILVAHRLQFPMHITMSGKLQDEGVRIPPTPLGSCEKINRDLLGAIGAHPLAPAQFTNAAELALAELQKIRQVLKSYGNDTLSPLKLDVFKAYFAQTQATFKTLLAKLPLGETQVSEVLPTGEVIKLKLEIHDEKVLFDFAGTDVSSHMQITDLGTFGACFQAVQAAVGTEIPANSGSFHQLEVRTPAKSLVNGKPPGGTTRGMTEGLATVCRLALKAFGKLHSSFRRGEPSCGTGAFELLFENGARFSDTVSGGMSAAADYTGLTGHNLWNPHFQTLSIEEIEKTFPIVVKTISPRTGSGGRGKYSGGEGMNKSYLLTAPARLTVWLEEVHAKPEHLEGGKPAHSGEVVVIGASGEKRTFERSGVYELKAGETIRILSAGGSGYGPPETSPAP